jgi:hypothetical protein
MTEYNMFVVGDPSSRSNTLLNSQISKSEVIVSAIPLIPSMLVVRALEMNQRTGYSTTKTSLLRTRRHPQQYIGDIQMGDFDYETPRP